MEAFQPKDEEENSMHNTVVMFSTSDHFTLKQVKQCSILGDHPSLFETADLRVRPTLWH